MIKALIFDYGGVIGFDPRSSIYTLVGKKINIDPLIIKHKFSTYSELLQRGDMNENNFWNQLSKDLKYPDPKFLRQTWLSVFISKTVIDNDVLSLITRFKSKYKLCLLSNSISFYQKESPVTPQLERLFDYLIYSFDVKMRKPGIKIYLYTLKLIGLLPNECIIVDDGKQNLITPNKMGMHTIYFKTCSQLEKDLNQLISQSSDVLNPSSQTFSKE